jgi:hypothetical protein
MMSKKEILLEGKYDSFTKKIVNDIMGLIKQTEGVVGEVEQFDLPNEEDSYVHQHSGININLDLRIYRVDSEIEYGSKKIPYHINSFIAEDDYLVIEILINEEYEQKYYQEIYYKLNEDVRHEIEHYVQQIGLIDDRFKDRQQPSIDKTAEYETTYLHHQDPSEVESLVRGFYRRAKVERLPLDTIMQKDLESDIENGNITQEEAKDLFSIWLKYAKRNLPNAKYSI